MTFACALGNRIESLGSNVNSGHIPGLDDSAPFDPYTIAAPEFRRLLSIATWRFPSEDFEIRGAILPGIEGDEAWRANEASSRFVIIRRQQNSLLANDTQTMQCIDLDSQLPCDKWTEMTLLAQPSDHWLAIVFRKVLLQQPYPVVFDESLAHRRVHCFGP